VIATPIATEEPAMSRTVTPLPSLRLDLLQTFLVTAEELCMSTTARRLYVSPSGLSRRITTLEAELGVSLFERHTRAMRLTPAGAALLPHARAMVTVAQAALDAVGTTPQAA
jgi:DNA-binding transcriptional LysR family regulator